MIAWLGAIANRALIPLLLSFGVTMLLVNATGLLRPTCQVCHTDTIIVTPEPATTQAPSPTLHESPSPSLCGVSLALAITGSVPTLNPHPTPPPPTLPPIVIPTPTQEPSPTCP